MADIREIELELATHRDEIAKLKVATKVMLSFLSCEYDPSIERLFDKVVGKLVAENQEITRLQKLSDKEWFGKLKAENEELRAEIAKLKG
tara:strand:- start:3187 stop:3456 length:270 start_codon:yes stop_codon:yes gene_type:complete